MSIVATSPPAPALRVKPSFEPWAGRFRRPVLVGGITSSILALAYLFAPPMGTDLAAQTARGDFYAAHGARLVDFGWYGGTSPLGYSWFAAPANALLGARGVGALSAVIASLAFAWLLARFSAPRAALASAAGALVFICNIVSGRTTFALGLAIGLLALCALRVYPSERWRLWPGSADNSGSTTTALGWDLAAFGLALLATGASPVAGVFVAIAGSAAALVGYWRSAVILIAGTVLGMAPFLMLFADGGVQLYTEDSMRIAAAACIFTFFLIPGKQPVLRAGALLAGLAVIAAYYLPTALGSNIMRLPMLFAVPLVLAYAQLSRPLLTVASLALIWFQPPLMTFDLHLLGERAATRAYYEPLLAELDSKSITGRVEVVPLSSHWESVYVAGAVPLARGWLRQLDVQENALFYNGKLNAVTYQQWLAHNGVQYIALPKRAKVDFRGGRPEARLLDENLSYLTLEWESADWRLFAVRSPTGIVQAPATFVSADAARVRFTTSQPGDIHVRVRWSRWLTVRGPAACVRPGRDWVVVRVDKPGSYELTSEFSTSQPARC
ncbi:MAG: hypothetical protein HOQ05_04380 [Corynebacteriales bacterium]|nr:hypothetical protein [Mycobacteriales bacterium]